MTRSPSQGFRRIGLAALFWLCCTSHTWAQTSTINIQARSTLAANVGAIMQVRLNAVVVGSVEVRAASWQTYSFNVPTGTLPGGAIDVVFTNDALINAQDRNLYVLSVGVNGLNLSPTALGVVYDRGVGPAAFDGLDLAAAGTGMPWAGALRFPALPAAVAPPISPAPVVSFEYDANSNPTKTVQAPGVAGLNLATASSYDALNRRKDTTDAASGVVRFAYNGQDSLTQVTDPRNLVTQTPRNGLGDITQLVSPDTGTANATYDAAGNLKSRTDSRGALAAYSYDALNRLTGAVHSLTGQSTKTLGWQYDEATSTHGVGRLTSTTFPAGSSRYQYDPQGRVISVARVINALGTTAAVSQTVSYGYDAAGKVTSVVYPSGRRLSITHTAGLPSEMALAASSTAAATPLLSGITWEPFGDASRWLWRLNTDVYLHERVYDSYGRPVRYRLGPNTVRSVSYDAADRIVAFSHVDAGTGAATPAADQSFGYDALGRLTQVTTASTSWSYTYDTTGNRTAQTVGGSTRSYSVASTSNRIGTISNPARSFSYDAAGNTTSDSAAYTATYDPQGRLATLTRAGVVATYSHDAEGLRVRKSLSTGAAGTVLFVHDQGGQLLGEYDATGKALREYIWLGATPVAMFTPDPAAAANPPLVYYIHADHLNTPRAVVDRSNRLRWRWLSEPFGVSAPETNPAGLGAFTFNLRFPGQYFDQESGLSDNWNRSYDNTVGRYTQSDPIGLAGGINTYAYVGGNPISYVDPMGLMGGGGYSAAQRRSPMTVSAFGCNGLGCVTGGLHDTGLPQVSAELTLGGGIEICDGLPAGAQQSASASDQSCKAQVQPPGVPVPKRLGGAFLGPSIKADGRACIRIGPHMSVPLLPSLDLPTRP